MVVSVIVRKRNRNVMFHGADRTFDVFSAKPGLDRSKYNTASACNESIKQ